MSVARIRDAWRHFWWGTVDPRLPAALRIGFALVAIHTHLSWWPEVDTLLDAAGQARNVVAPLSGRGFSLFSHPAVTGDLAQWLHGATLLPLVAMLFGVGGRWPVLVTWAVVLGWYHRAPGASTGGDRLLRFALLYLVVGTTTARWSVDAWWARRQGRALDVAVSALPVRLIQVQWVAMYLLSGIDKARGATWQHGTALHYALSNRTFSRAQALLEPLVESPVLGVVLMGATYGVLAWELLFPALVVPRRTRWLALLIGLLVHLGIGLTMSVGPFTAVTMVGYLAFLDRPDGIGGRLDRLASRVCAGRVQSLPRTHEHRASTEPTPSQEKP